MFSCLRLASCCLALIMAVTPFALADDAVPLGQFRGPDGTLTAGRLPEGAFGLQEVWARSLGSGYSNIWIADDKAVTMFTSDEVDVVAAFDLTNGDELWRYELGPKYAGHDGSDDGPIGTPAVGDGTVYALGPSGRLVALSLADGTEKWRRELTEENSTVPFYGYTASPLIVGTNVIVTTGGEGHAVTAFDRATGEPKWTSGDDSVSYQTPMVVELAGRQQLLAVTDHFLQGLDLSGGEVLWQLRHTEDDQTEQSAHPTVIDGERFLIKYGRGARLYRFADGAVEEVWQSRAFGNTYALPVRVGDHLYGFTGNVLTCASVESGEIVWRSRELGGLGLALVDGVIAVLSAGGDLVLVDPSPDGYREMTRTSVFEEGDYAIPSFVDGLFLVRNLDRFAALRVNTSMAPRVRQPDDEIRLKGEFATWVASIEALPEGERQAAVDRRFEGVETTPLFGNDGLAHIVWRGAAEDVAVQGSFDANGEERVLHHVAGTDLFCRSLELDSKAQYTYILIVDYGDPVPDPGNAHSVDNGFAVASELRMPEWPASPHLDPPAEGAARGTLDQFQFHSEILDNTREIRVWRPADYGRDAEQRYPVLVVNHGDNLLRGGLMQNSLDNLVGKSVAPLIAVFVPRVSPPEYGGDAAANYARFLVEELLPHLDRHYLTDPGHRAIMGPGSAGVAAVRASLEHPDVFKKAAAQSFYAIEPTQAGLPELIGGADPKPELIYMVWSHNDYDLGDGLRAEETSRELIGQLREAGVNVTEHVADYTPGWGGWRGQHDEVLAALFPAAEE